MRGGELSYDYIVVGAGTAGCVLAARLSEAEGVRVLLLEAGGREPVTATPQPWPNLLDTPLSWGGFTVPQREAGTEVLLSRGKVLGGSSAINAMLFARGHRSSYDAWVDGGAKGWGFADLLPYMKRSENAMRRDPALRGIGGPLTVAPADPPNPVVEDLLEAASQAGHPRAADISGGLAEGFGLPDMNIVHGKRQSAADAYLTPVLGRPNLDVVTDTLVHRLRIEDGRATGIEFTVAGEPAREPVRVGCSAEIVLTAGVIGSAQLLMLSGVGPRAHLTEFGIRAVQDLPGVGQNLQDHPIINMVYASSRPIPPGRDNHGEAFGLVRSDSTVDYPDLQILFVDAPGHLPSAQAPEQGYTISVSNMRPHSRGTVRLANPRPGAHPVLDPRYYSDERDLTAIVAGLRMAREIGRAGALDVWRGREVAPGTDVDDDAGLRAFALATMASYCHPVGTCRIGQDGLAVVDAELRVHGIAGLRVADGSVLPATVSANTNATIYAIAERAADLIAS